MTIVNLNMQEKHFEKNLYLIQVPKTDKNREIDFLFLREQIF